ncbi:13760_t:CDS:2, partial [Entrophospora sp. SA101]
ENLTDSLNEVEESHVTGDEEGEEDINEEQIIALDFKKKCSQSQRKDIIDPEEDDFVPARRNNPPGRKLFNPYANKPKDIWQEQSPSSYQTDRHRG